MNKVRWLTILGGICVIAVICVGLTGFSSNFSDFKLPFIVLGTILSIIVIGIGEILYHLKNGEKKE